MQYELLLNIVHTIRTFLFYMFGIILFAKIYWFWRIIVKTFRHAMKKSSGAKQILHIYVFVHNLFSNHLHFFVILY
jgi:hypothetical protein